MADDSTIPTPVYANVVDFTLGPFDIVIDFGFKLPSKAARTRRSSQTSPAWR